MKLLGIGVHSFLQFAMKLRFVKGIIDHLLLVTLRADTKENTSSVCWPQKQNYDLQNKTLSMKYSKVELTLDPRLLLFITFVTFYH
jgi:hypothetical protein